MVDVLVLGTIALDNIETPFKKGSNLLGGSAVYAAYAVSFFSKPGIVSVIGKDMPSHYIELLANRGINIKGIKESDKTFRWHGYYEFDMNEAKTIRTELNAIESFKPHVPEEYKNAKYIFLANLDPELQIDVLRQIARPELVILDTMNFWIEHKKEKLLEVIRLADILLLNDGEARQLFETTNLVQAANKALRMVKKAVIIKKGEHGALLFTKEPQASDYVPQASNSVASKVLLRSPQRRSYIGHFNAPGYPLENVFDPTGCGDSFGGALIGYLAKIKSHNEGDLRKAVIYGSVIASFTAEDFSINRLTKLSDQEIEKRFRELREIRKF